MLEHRSMVEQFLGEALRDCAEEYRAAKKTAASGTTGDGDPTQCCSGMIFQKVPRIRLVEPEYGRFETIPGKLFQNGMSIRKISAFLTVAKFAGLRLPL